MSARYIFTEKNNCQDCYKCIRECPVKAIKVEDLSASVMPENCIYCGHCTEVCPVEAKKVREDISYVKYLLSNHSNVIISLAPTYITEFSEIPSPNLIKALEMLGFSMVSETAIGAEIISSSIKEKMPGMEKGVHISPCCPATVELIKKYHPAQADKILPIDTPMLAHGKFLREKYGKDIKIVFIGPCIAKKKEADMNPGIIDAVITFQNLRKWFAQENIDPLEISADQNNKFEPFEAGKGNLYPSEGGMIACLKEGPEIEDVKYISLSGISRLTPLLSDLDKLGNKHHYFLELMACDGGCINGPCTSHTESVAIKNLRINSYSKQDKKLVSYKEIALENNYDYISELKKPVYKDSEIIDTLHSIGKYTTSDELNCGGCGYESCRDFASAVLEGKAERKMCISYMRRVAQDKASVLLQSMPYGVVIVDKKLKIVESNRNFAEIAGNDALLVYDAKPGLEGADLRKLIAYSHLFENFIESGEEKLERDIKNENHFVHLSIFPLHGNDLLCGIVHNLRAPELKREEIVKRTRTVIRDNLNTVQKIAFYLGENASNMETLLNSIVDIHNEEE